MRNACNVAYSLVIDKYLKDGGGTVEGLLYFQLFGIIDGSNKNLLFQSIRCVLHMT